MPHVSHHLHLFLYILFIYLFTIEVKRSGTSDTVVFKTAWLSDLGVVTSLKDVAQDVAQNTRCGTDYILVNVLCGFLKSSCLILLTSKPLLCSVVVNCLRVKGYLNPSISHHC